MIGKGKVISDNWCLQLSNPRVKTLGESWLFWLPLKVHPLPFSFRKDRPFLLLLGTFKKIFFFCSEFSFLQRHFWARQVQKEKKLLNKGKQDCRLRPLPTSIWIRATTTTESFLDAAALQCSRVKSWNGAILKHHWTKSHLTRFLTTYTVFVCKVDSHATILAQQAHRRTYFKNSGTSVLITKCVSVVSPI